MRWRRCYRVGGDDGYGRSREWFPRDMRRGGVRGRRGGYLVDQGGIGGEVTVQVVQAGSDV